MKAIFRYLAISVFPDNVESSREIARNSKIIVELSVQKEILFKCDWTVRGEHIN